MIATITKLPVIHNSQQALISKPDILQRFEGKRQYYCKRIDLTTSKTRIQFPAVLTCEGHYSFARGTSRWEKVLGYWQESIINSRVSRTLFIFVGY